MANYPIASRFDKMANPDTNTTGDYVLDGLNTFYPEFMQSENAQDFSGKNCNILDDVLYITKNSNCIITGEGDADVDQVKLINFDCHNGNHINLLAGRGKKITLIESIPQLVLGIESMELSETDPVRFQKVAGNWYYRGLLPTSETQVGLARKATFEEVNSGITDSEKGVSFVTPEQMTYYMNSKPSYNYIPNSNFQINSLGTQPFSFTGTGLSPGIGSIGHVFDCWSPIVLDAIGSINPLINTSSPVLHYPYYRNHLNIKLTRGSNDCRFVVPIEKAGSFLGEKVTLSFFANSAQSSEMSVRLDFWSNNSTLSSTEAFFSLSPEDKIYYHTFTIDKLEGVNIIGSDAALLFVNFVFSTSADIRTGEWDIQWAKLERGEQVTRYEPTPITQDLDLCGRFIQSYADFEHHLTSTLHQGSAEVVNIMSFSLRQEMRGYPSVITQLTGANGAVHTPISHFSGPSHLALFYFGQASPSNPGFAVGRLILTC